VVSKTRGRRQYECPDPVDAVVRARVELEQNSSSIASQLAVRDPGTAPENVRRSDGRHRLHRGILSYDAVGRELASP